MPVVNDFTAIIQDNDAFRWNGARELGTPVIVTYSFDDRAAELPPESDFPTRDIGDFTTGFSSAGQQTIVRDALALYEASGGIRFVEVETDGMMQFVDATSIVSNGRVVSFASLPSVNASNTSAGHVVMNQDHFPLGQGNSGFGILLHEIGHAVGFDHSDDGTNTLNPALDTVANTVMNSTGSGAIVADIGALDKDALAFLYGLTDDFNFDLLTVAVDVGNSEIDIAGTSGADKFMAPDFDTNIDGGAGDDIILGNASDDEIDGDAGDDMLFGAAGDDILRGGAGADTLDGLGFIDGGNFLGGADRLFGGAGDDTLIARFDTALYDGGDGDDIVDGSQSSQVSFDMVTDAAMFVSIETLMGSPGDDFLFGDANDNVLLGGGGDDTLFGREGDDVYGVDDAADQIFETSGVDTVIASIAYALPGSIENGVATGTGLLEGNGGANTLGGNGVGNVLAGLGGADILVGRGGDDDLSGGDGADRLNGGSGADTMAGGDGNDIYSVDNVGDVVTELVNEGIDRINTVVDYVNVANVEFLAGLAAPVGLALTGGSGRDRITGARKIGSGDTLSGEGGNDKLVGLPGDDSFDGGQGNDRIFGNSGDDTIAGGVGNDRLTGQFGADTFVHAPGDHRDRITDFDVAQDLLDLTAHGFANAAAVLAATSDTGGGALIDFTGPNSILLEGVAKAAIGQEDILT